MTSHCYAAALAVVCSDSATTEILCVAANFRNSSSSSKIVRPPSMASTFCAGGQHRSQRAHADGRHVEAHVLLRLGNFHDREVAFLAQVAGAEDAGVGSFDCFDGQDRAVLYAHALTDVERSPFVWRLPSRIRYRIVAWPKACGLRLSNTNRTK